MIKKIGYHIENSIAFTSLTLIFFSLISKFIGIYRDRLLTGSFGAGDILDSYFSAFKVPDFIYNILILGTFSSAFIPLFSTLILKKEQRQEAQKLVSDVFFILSCVMGVLGIGMFFGAEYLARIVALSYTPEKFNDTVTLMRIMAFSPLIFSISSLVSSILNTHKKFIVSSLAPIMYNIGIIVGILYLYPRVGIKGLGFGVILGAFLHLFIQIPSLMSLNLMPRTKIDFNLNPLSKLWKLYWPRLLVLDTATVSIFIGTIFASTQTRAVSILNLSFNLNSLPLSVVAISFATAIFPHLSQAYAHNDDKKFLQYVNQTLIRILFLVLPLTLILIDLRGQLVRIVYGTGNFSWEDTRLTLACFSLFAISLPFQSIIPLFSRICYARHDTKSPMVIGIIGMFVSVFLSFILNHWFGLYGITMAFSLTIVIVFLMYYIVIFKKLHQSVHNHNLGAVIFKSTWIDLVKISGASIIGFLAAHGVKTLFGTVIDTNTFIEVFSQVCIVSGVGFSVYFGLVYLLKVNVSNVFLRKILKRS